MYVDFLREHKSGREVFCMKKYFVIIIAILVSAFAFAQLKDVPTDHWAYESVEALVNAGIITGYPDGTFRGASSVTRYEAAVLLSRLMEKIELDLGEVIKNRYLNSLKLINTNKDQISSLYKVVKGNSDKLDELNAKLEEFSKTLAMVESLKVTVDVHEGDITALYDISGKLKKDLGKVNLSIEALEKSLNDSLANVNGQIEFLYKKINLSEENVKAYADEKVNELKGKVLNIESTVNDGLPVLRDLVYQNSTNIKNLEVKLMKYINVKVNSISKNIDEVKEMAEFNVDTLNGLAMKLGEFEYSLRKRIENVEKDVEGINANIETKADKEEVEALANEVNSVKTKSTFGLLLGVTGVGLSIVALLKAFGII
ncbi:MAG: hypothetical protein PWP54_35 [Thermosipho sp. (in: thermotogales)]|nr:hypothetical protein [Thermosipho sp. (in: thermotogales)]